MASNRPAPDPAEIPTTSYPSSWRIALALLAVTLPFHTIVVTLDHLYNEPRVFREMTVVAIGALVVGGRYAYVRRIPMSVRRRLLAALWYSLVATLLFLLEGLTHLLLAADVHPDMILAYGPNLLTLFLTNPCRFTSC